MSLSRNILGSIYYVGGEHGGFEVAKENLDKVAKENLDKVAKGNFDKRVPLPAYCQRESILLVSN